MSVLEACCVAVTVYAGVLVWLLIDVVQVHVETRRYLLARAKSRDASPPVKDATS